jgi:spermidine synthase
VDGFDETGLPAALVSAKFYADCRRALRREGLLVANVFSYDARYPALMRRLDLIYNQKVCWFDRTAGNNRILFAVNVPFRQEPGEALAWPVRLQGWVARRHGLGLPVLNRLLVHAVIFWFSLGSRYRPATRGPYR